MKIYIIGSLRNPEIPKIENYLREQGIDTFAEWFGAGEIADDRWMEYQKGLGHNFQQALESYAAQNVFHFDKTHLDRCDAAVLILPAGKSGHMELGYTLGRGKRGFILMDKEPERYDVMYNFATAVCLTKEELVEKIKQNWITWRSDLEKIYYESKIREEFRKQLEILENE